MRRFIAVLLVVTLCVALMPHGNAASTATMDVAAGRYHALLLRESGTVYAWGDSRYGQTGDGSTSDCSSPTAVLRDAVSIAAGYWASYAVTIDGSVYVWGNNEQGQLGLGDYVSRSAPTRIATISDAVAVVSSQNRAYVLTKYGDVYAFGNSALLYPMEVGRLSNKPRKIAENVDKVFAGSGATLFLRGTKLTAFGNAIPGSVDTKRAVTETTLSSSAVYAAASATDAYFVDTQHRLYRFGKPSSLLLSGIASVAVSDAHCAAVGTGGLLYTWGANEHGELGQGASDTSRAAEAVLRNVAGASAGDGYTIAVGARGELWCFGSNTAYRLGTGTNRLDYNAPHRVLAANGEYADAESLPYRVVFNGAQMSFDVPPTQRGGHVLVPLRAIFERLGASVDWDEATLTATATLGSTAVRVTIGSRTAYVNGEAVQLDTVAEQTGWRTLVPVRFVSEALGATVEYVASERIIEIRSRDAVFELTGDAAARLGAMYTAVTSTMPGGIATAGGVVVHTGGLIVTNRHVVEGATEVSVTFGGATYKAEVYYTDDVSDFAILKIGATFAAAPTAGALPPHLDDIALVAAANGVAEARVTNTRYGDTAAPSFLLNATVAKGTSGSGVYNRELELIGIVYGGVGELSYAACLPYELMRARIAAAVAYYGLK